MTKNPRDRLIEIILENWKDFSTYRQDEYGGDQDGDFVERSTKSADAILKEYSPINYVEGKQEDWEVVIPLKDAPKYCDIGRRVNDMKGWIEMEDYIKLKPEYGDKKC